MAPAKPVIITHEGDRNPKLLGIGLMIVFVGLILLNVDAGFGGFVMFIGLVLVVGGAQKSTRKCPSCRTAISPQAAVCPQCHVTTGWVSREAA